jgi:hypothetical protein
MLSPIYLIIRQQGPPSDHGFGGYMAFFGLLLIVFTLLLVVAFVLLFPRLEKVKTKRPIEAEVEKLEGAAKPEEAEGGPLDVTLRLLNEDEGRIVRALVGAGGSMLQKDISYDLGLSRVKTHRVLVGLIERGVVYAEKHYNTNKITLAEWLKPNESGSKPHL